MTAAASVPASFRYEVAGIGSLECAPALSPSRSFVRRGAPSCRLRRVGPWAGEPSPGGGRTGRGPVASGVQVREVADPKCRCAGVGRPRWILETPRSALPDPHHARYQPWAGGRLGVGDRGRQRSCAWDTASHRLKGLRTLAALAPVLGPTVGVQSGRPNSSRGRRWRGRPSASRSRPNPSWAQPFKNTHWFPRQALLNPAKPRL